MKMNRSIKDYKDAMDSVKISDSFYKRTETLLNDLSEDDIDRKPFYLSKKITMGVMAAAACFVCLIGVRVVLDVRNDNIGSVTETSLTKISAETVTEVMTTPALIDDIETEEAAFGDIIEDEDTQEIIAEEPAFDASAAEDPEVAAAVPEEGKDDAGNAAIPEAYAISIDDQTAAFPVPTEEEKEGYPDISVKGTDNIPPLTAMIPSNVNVEITPYFDMGEITSGEMITKSGDEISDIIGTLKGIPTSSKKTDNGEFVSLFALQISDKETGDVFYSIYITDDGKAVITKHSSPQERTTYSLLDTNYDLLQRSLFLLFGEESDYTLFENLVSGR